MLCYRYNLSFNLPNKTKVISIKIAFERSFFCLVEDSLCFFLLKFFFLQKNLTMFFYSVNYYSCSIHRKKGKAKMKRLSAKTIQSYSSVKLAKHLDRLMDKFDVAPFRIDFSYDTVYEFSKSDSSYHHLMSINDYNKDELIDCIDSAWRTLSND